MCLIVQVQSRRRCLVTTDCLGCLDTCILRCMESNIGYNHRTNDCIRPRKPCQLLHCWTVVNGLLASCKEVIIVKKPDSSIWECRLSISIPSTSQHTIIYLQAFESTNCEHDVWIISSPRQALEPFALYGSDSCCVISIISPSSSIPPIVLPKRSFHQGEALVVEIRCSPLRHRIKTGTRNIFNTSIPVSQP